MEGSITYCTILWNLTVNLADAGRRRYLKATVTLAFTDRALAGELLRSEPKLRDLIIGVLRSKTVEGVSTLMALKSSVLKL